jgi:hypothetical protein
MAAADPIPISADPDVSCVRRGADNFDARRGRRDHHDSPGIVPLIRDDHASGQRHAEHEPEKASCENRFALIHDLFQFYKECKDPNVFRPLSLTRFWIKHTAAGYGAPPERGLVLSLRRRVSRCSGIDWAALGGGRTIRDLSRYMASSARCTSSAAFSP